MRVLVHRPERSFALSMFVFVFIGAAQAEAPIKMNRADSEQKAAVSRASAATAPAGDIHTPPTSGASSVKPIEGIRPIESFKPAGSVKPFEQIKPIGPKEPIGAAEKRMEPPRKPSKNAHPLSGAQRINH